MPPKNVAVCGAPPALGTDDSCSFPAFTSIVEPSGMSSAEVSVTNRLEPLSLTLTLPLTGLITTVLWNTGAGGAGLGVGVGTGSGWGPGPVSIGSMTGAVAPSSNAPTSHGALRGASRWSVGTGQLAARPFAGLVAGIVSTSV